MKKKLIIIYSMCLAAVLCASSFALSDLMDGKEDAIAANAVLGKKGAIIATVCDGITKQPIKNATIVIPEINKKYTTDSNGRTKKMELPILNDAKFDKILVKPWGEVTLLVYAENYLPCALFNTQVPPGQTRDGLEILLFTSQSANSDASFSFIEGPNRQWVEELVKKYAD